jgi:hypothetical protein
MEFDGLWWTAADLYNRKCSHTIDLNGQYWTSTDMSISHTKAKERRGETAKDEAEDKAPRRRKPTR